jgi:integrase
MASSKKKKHHHMVKRGDVWYFAAMVKGKRYLQVLSSDVHKAITMRDDFLYEIRKFGKIVSNTHEIDQQEKGNSILFGQVAQEWAKIKAIEIKQDQIKSSTMRDYRSSMNLHILPNFGNRPICKITASDVEDFVRTLTCSPKRINNILVPLRSLFKLAKKKGYVSENIMLDVDNLKIDQPDIYPLSIDQVKTFLENIVPHFKPFFTVAFFTGMRFGEMAALKWRNVDLRRGLIYVRETRVYAEEGRPKTKKSIRDIDILPPVRDALLNQKSLTGKGDYVFRDASGNLLNTDHVRNVIWIPALKKAEIGHRPMLQTRHTFATMMIDSGEDLGWVQRMMGHSSLQMIFTRYYSWVKRDTRNDGSAFLKKMYAPEFDVPDNKKPPQNQVGKIIQFTSNLHQARKKGLRQNSVNP